MGKLFDIYKRGENLYRHFVLFRRIIDPRFSTGRELNRSLEIYYTLNKFIVVDKTRQIIYQINK